MDIKSTIETMAARGVTVRLNEAGKLVIVPKGSASPEDSIFLRENYVAVIAHLGGSLDEEELSPMKPAVSPKVWIERVRAAMGTKSAYDQWPDMCLGLAAAGSEMPKVGEDINPRQLPSLYEVLCRPENAGCELHIATIFAFSIMGTRRDQTDFEVVRFSYDGLPLTHGQKRATMSKRFKPGTLALDASAKPAEDDAAASF
jgi:hypothetical protein